MQLLDWRLFALGSALFAALTAIFGKIAVSSLNSNFATFLRTLVILAITSITLSLKNEWQPLQKLELKPVIFLILSGIATAFSWLCYYRALQLGPASKVAPLDKLSVVLSVLMAVLFLGEKLDLKSILGALLIAAGSIILSL